MRVASAVVESATDIAVVLRGPVVAFVLSVVWVSIIVFAEAMVYGGASVGLLVLAPGLVGVGCVVLLVVVVVVVVVVLVAFVLLVVVVVVVVVVV
jgi:hypothetical protein